METLLSLTVLGISANTRLLQYDGIGLLLQLCTVQLDKLQRYVEGLGGHLSDGWTVKMILRAGGGQAGKYDNFYIAPGGRQFNSKVNIRLPDSKK